MFPTQYSPFPLSSSGGSNLGSRPAPARPSSASSSIWSSSDPRSWMGRDRVQSWNCNMYRVTHHLYSYILLTSKQKFPCLVGRYCSYLLPTQALSTFNLMSTEHRNQGDVSPCRHHSTDKICFDESFLDRVGQGLQDQITPHGQLKSWKKGLSQHKFRQLKKRLEKNLARHVAIHFWEAWNMVVITFALCTRKCYLNTKRSRRV